MFIREFGRVSVAALAAAVACTAVVAQGAAAATWSEPVRLWDAPDRNFGVGMYSLQFTSGGTALAVWSPLVRDERGIVFRAGPLVSTRPRGGTFGPAQRLLAGVNFEPAGFAVDSRSRLTLLAEMFHDDMDGDIRSGVQAFRGFVGPTGEVRVSRRAQVLTRRAALSTLAANDRGDAVAAWRYGYNDDAIGAVRAVISTGGGRFTRSTLITRGRARSVRAAVNTRGDAVVVWQEGVRIYARVAPRGRPFGPRLAVGASGGPDPAGFDVAIGAGGDVLVAWRHGSADSTAVLAALARTGRRFERPVTLDTYPSSAEQQYTVPDVAVVGDRFFVAWNGVEIKLATVTRGGSSTQIVAAGGTFRVQLATRADGAAVVAWSREVSGRSDAFAAVLGADGALGAPELIAAGDAVLPRVAFDPVTGEPSAVFGAIGRPSLSASDRSP